MRYFSIINNIYACDTHNLIHRTTLFTMEKSNAKLHNFSHRLKAAEKGQPTKLDLVRVSGFFLPEQVFLLFRSCPFRSAMALSLSIYGKIILDLRCLGVHVY